MSSTSADMQSQAGVNNPPSSDNFHVAMAEYYAIRDQHNAAKQKLFDDLPPQAPSTLAQAPRQKHWWTKEIEQGWSERFPSVEMDDANLYQASAVPTATTDTITSTLAEQNLKDADPTRQRHVRDLTAAIGTEHHEFQGIIYTNEHPVCKTEYFDDVEFFRQVTGRAGLVVPADLKFP